MIYFLCHGAVANRHGTLVTMCMRQRSTVGSLVMESLFLNK